MYVWWRGERDVVIDVVDVVNVVVVVDVVVVVVVVVAVGEVRVSSRFTYWRYGSACH